MGTEIRPVAEELIEAAWYATAQKPGDTTKQMYLWIDAFEAEVNNRLPKNVWIDVGSCQQMGDIDNFLDDDEYKVLLNEVEQYTDDRVDIILGLADEGAEPEKLWYAVMKSLDDTDWSIGSFSKAEAMEMLARYRKDRPTAYIAVVSGAGTDNAKCVDELEKDTAIWAMLNQNWESESDAEN